MKHSRRAAVAAAAAAAALFVTVSVSTAHADPTSAVQARIYALFGMTPEAVDRMSESGAASALVALDAGASEEELRSDAAELAAQLGVTPLAVLKQQFIEARESAAAADEAGQVAIAASSGGGTVVLGDATNRGDIFVSPASTLFIQHGHTGIYYTAKVIVEAPGAGKKSHAVVAANVRVGKGAVKQHVSTSQANRDKAANYAYNNMLNKPYNGNFAANRTVPAASYNCSQLVWGAYKATTNLDLDSNGGLGVYPYNIKDSKLTATYQTL